MKVHYHIRGNKTVVCGKPAHYDRVDQYKNIGEITCDNCIRSIIANAGDMVVKVKGRIKPKPPARLGKAKGVNDG